MLLLLLLWLPLSFAQEPDPGMPSGSLVIERVVAVVGDRIVTESDVRLEGILAMRDPSPVPVLRIRQQEDPLAMLIDAALVRGLAGNIALYAPSPAEVRQRVERIRESFATVAAWQEFLAAAGLDEDRLAGQLYSRLVVERYVHRNVGLASEAAGESRQAYLQRYLLWIEEERKRAQIRVVEALHP